MMQMWEQDMVRFMRDASEYGTYHRELAGMLSPDLSAEMHVCDAGSGLGYLSLALAPYVKRVTAVERHPRAAAVLEENCREKGVHNVVSCCGSIEDAAPADPYDAMVFCFFGSVEEILTLAKQQCKGTVFVITRNYTTHRFSVGQHAAGDHGYRNFREEFIRRGIPVEEDLFEVEFGQPFRTFADARGFYEIYSKDPDRGVITDAFLREKLVETGDETFPFYLPHRRSLALIKFRAADIP